MPVNDYPRCRTCKHWIERDATGHGCKSAKFHGGYGITHKQHEGRLLQILADEVIVENDEGWQFQPGPDFGCVHHEVR